MSTCGFVKSNTLLADSSRMLYGTSDTWCFLTPLTNSFRWRGHLQDKTSELVISAGWQCQQWHLSCLLQIFRFARRTFLCHEILFDVGDFYKGYDIVNIIDDVKVA